MATRIPSEHEGYLRPLVERTATLFGDPIATIRDMGEGVGKAVASLRARGVSDFVCHYHFLAAVGKKLFEKPYRVSGNLLRRHKVQGDLRALLRELRRYRKSHTFAGRFGPGPVREELLAWVLWILDGEGKKALLYPFSLPYLELINAVNRFWTRPSVGCPYRDLSRSGVPFRTSCGCSNPSNAILALPRRCSNWRPDGRPSPSCAMSCS